MSRRYRNERANGSASGAGAFRQNLCRRMNVGFSISCARRLQAGVSPVYGLKGSALALLLTLVIICLC